MFIYSNGVHEKLDVQSRVHFDHLIDIRSNFERMFSHQNDWVHFPFRLIREGNRLPEHVHLNKRLYIFNGCPYGIISRKAVDYLTKMGYTGCFTLTAADAV
jgi:rhodanese-related sulfurtransferase